MKHGFKIGFCIFFLGTAVWASPAADPLMKEIHEDFKSGHAVEAVARLRTEAARGNPTAEYGLALLYENGSPQASVEKDEVQALKWYRLAAQNGHAPSQNNLGYCYFSGHGVTKDDQQAVFWYEKAAAQNDPMAQYNLANMYYHGYGVKKNIDTALGLYRQAADQGNLTAENNLGFLYEHGRGVRRDHREAMRWYQKAAESGHRYAQMNVAVMYERGLGVRRNLVDAYTWYWISSQHGNVKATKALADLEKKLTPAQIVKAKKRAARYMNVKVSS